MQTMLQKLHQNKLLGVYIIFADHPAARHAATGNALPWQTPGKREANISHEVALTAANDVERRAVCAEVAEKKRCKTTPPSQHGQAFERDVRLHTAVPPERRRFLRTLHVRGRDVVRN
jgi:hypothetical protein